MWVAVLLTCMTPLAKSCQVLAKSDEFFYSEEACKAETTTMVLYLESKSFSASPFCFKVGESA